MDINDTNDNNDTTDEQQFPTWEEMLDQLKRGRPRHLLAFDPGETTGFARFVNGHLMWSEQLKTHTILEAASILDCLIAPNASTTFEVVIENYQVFKWRAKQHVGDTLHTPRLIGAIELLCALRGINLTKQTPQNAKGFSTDAKLKAWDMYRPGQPHARDAIRHGIYYILFQKSINPYVEDKGN